MGTGFLFFAISHTPQTHYFFIYLVAKTQIYSRQTFVLDPFLPRLMLSYQYAPAVAAVLIAYARADLLDDTLNGLAGHDGSPFAGGGDSGGMCSFRQDHLGFGA